MGSQSTAQARSTVEQQGKDASVLAHIQRLVAEEHRLFEQGELAPDKSKRLAEARWSWTSAGIFCASGAPCAKPAAMRPRRTSGRPKSWRSTSAEMQCSHLGLVRTDRPRSKGCEECIKMGDTWV